MSKEYWTDWNGATCLSFKVCLPNLKLHMTHFSNYICLLHKIHVSIYSLLNEGNTNKYNVVSMYFSMTLWLVTVQYSFTANEGCPMTSAPWPDCVEPQIGHFVLVGPASWPRPAAVGPVTGSRHWLHNFDSWIMTPHPAGFVGEGGISTNSCTCLIKSLWHFTKEEAN